jgi:very-short-patch-repair endonuclease
MSKKLRTPVLCSQIALTIVGLLAFFMSFVVRQVIPFWANYLLTGGFACLAVTLLLTPLEYEKTPVRRTFFSEKKAGLANVSEQNERISPQAIKLSEALSARGIRNELEAFDGHKHVDISIPWAKLYLEIDGKYHLTNPDQLSRDLNRDSYSHIDGKSTIHIPNYVVDRDLDALAESIAKVARERYYSQFEEPRNYKKRRIYY